MLTREMQDFQENRCRICPKTFCCKDCRSYHEEQFHNINSECEICIYGRASVKNASSQLLAHIKSVHWPVHCVFCQKTFVTLDELLLHETCPVRQDFFKMQTTPKTPVTSNADQAPSIEVTPFYKALQVAQEVGCNVSAIVITSTPLVPKEEIEMNTEKITPINQTYPHKSNLKLTDSSNLSDSKKSERKVTFSETPSVSEYCKKPKCLPVPKHMLCEEPENCSTDESSASLDDFKTPSADTHFEEKENFNNETVNVDKTYSTLWESALTKFEGSSITDLNKTNHFNISVQINLLSNAIQTDPSDSVHNKSTSLWSSMTNMVKSVVNNISTTAQNRFSSVSVKRSQSEEAEVPSVKRIKLSDLRCRRPLRDTGQPCTIRLIKPRYADKATQTDHYPLM